MSGDDKEIDIDSLGWCGKNCLLSHYVKPQNIATLAVLPIVVGIYSWIYIGGLWGVTTPEAISHLQVAVLVEDQGFLPSAILPGLPPPLNQTLSFGQLFLDALHVAPLNTTLTWYIFEENTTYDEAIQFLLDGNAWGVIHFPVNYTLDVFRSFFMPPGIYSDPVKAITQLRSFQQNMVNISIYLDEGRNYATISILNSVTTRVIRGFSATLLSTLLSTYSALTFALINVVNPNFFVTGLSSIVIKFHPVTYFGQNFASYVIMVLT